MDSMDYLLCQMELEGIQRVAHDLIERTSPNHEDFPLVLVVRTSEGELLTCFDNLLAVDVRNQLTVLDLPSEMEAAVQVLKISGFPVLIHHFKTYIFPDIFETSSAANVKYFDQNDPRVIEFGFHGLADQIVAIEQDQIILSACVSSRENARAAEAWVFTHPDHRGRGLAGQVVTAWAHAVQQDGKIPFYSYNIENINSANLVKKLNLIHIFDEVIIEKAF